MGCFSDSPSDSADAGVPSDSGPTDAGVPLPGGVPDPPKDPVSPVVACPNSCANTLTLSGCTVVGVHGSIQLDASAIYSTDAGSAPCSAGSFHWSTSSAKITLANVDSSTVTVNAGAQPSGGRGQEVVTCTWSLADCETVTKTVNITVVNVVFSESAAESYGYDDMDTPAVWTDDHVSVKQLGDTVVHVVVQGGVNGSELKFSTLHDDRATVDPAPAQAAFDLKIYGKDTPKAETNLVVRADCPAATEITRMYINVYKEKVVRAVVAKVWDKRHDKTKLNYPNLDVASANPLINPKAKAAVVRYELSDFSPTKDVVHIPYDNDGNGMLSWDIVKNGGDEFKAIQDGFKSADLRIAIVRDIVSVYYLDADAAIGDTTIKLRGISNNNFYSPDDGATIGTDAGAEDTTVKTATKNDATVTLTAALKKAHSAGDPVTMPSAGWSSDPIIIVEGKASEEDVKWTFFHETGHRALSLSDLHPKSTIMYAYRGWTDHRLRYMMQALEYDTTKENQWELIPRD